MGLRERPATFASEVPEARQYAPRQSRIDALAEVIQALLDGGEKDAGSIAREALTWVHEQSKNRTEFAEEREPQSPEETLNRIRTLLDDGTMLAAQQRMASMEERLLAAEQKAQEAEAARQAADERAEQARSTLRTFMDLAREYAEDDEEEKA